MLRAFYRKKHKEIFLMSQHIKKAKYYLYKSLKSNQSKDKTELKLLMKAKPVSKKKHSALFSQSLNIPTSNTQ